MTQFISVPCKKGYEVKLLDSISQYIRDTYGEEQCSSHSGAINDFNSMRSKMLNKIFDKHESSIAVVTKYYDQFVALEEKIPIEENGVRIDFKWEDAFSKESVFGKKSTYKLASGGYERICLLFNIASLYSQVAEIQNLSDDSGLKNATKYFQQAAGIFSYLKSAAPVCIQREPTMDMNVDTLSTLSTLMVAQAQELIYTKAARDQMKEGNVARIVQQAADLYADTLKLMQLNSVKSIWPKEWIPLVAGKQASYHAIAEYYQAKACGSSHAFGEQIARLKKASELMKTAAIRSGQKFMFKMEQERIRKDLETVEKENNMIYHDSIPEVGSLSAISKAVLARELPLENPINKDFKDLFVKIVPLALHAAMVMFHNKHKDMVNAEVFRLKEANNTLGGILTSLNLPAALEDGKDDDVPSTLMDKAAGIRQKGGIEKIEEMLNNLPDVLGRNDELLRESVRMLDEEEESDKKLREQFKDRWNRTPSVKLTEPWRTEASKLTGVLNSARNSDQLIRKLYQEHCTYIRMLSENESTLRQSIPKSAGTDNTTDRSQSVKQDVRQVYNEIESMKNARTSLIADLTATEESNIDNAFTRALAEDGSLNHEHLADEQLNRMLQPFRERVRQSLDSQEQLLIKLQDRCSQMSGGDTTNRSRATIISALFLAADKFNELTGNLDEGFKFYGDLTEILLKFQNKVQDFCFARKTEKDELMKDLQSAIVKERTEVTSAPGNNSTYQATSAGTDSSHQVAAASNVPPPRPSQTYPIPGNTNAPSAPSNQPPPGVPYAPSPYNTPQQPYMSGGHPYQYPQYGYQQPPPPQGHMGGQVPQYQSGQVPQYQPGQVPQYQPAAPGQMPQYPPQYPPQSGQMQPPYGSYNYPTYPGYNPYSPR